MPRRKNFQIMINKDDNGGRLERFIFDVLHVERGSDRNKGDNVNYLVLLNADNSRIIEDKIENDQNYITFTKNLVEYYKSTNGGEFPITSEREVLAVVRMIDVENSTNVWRFNRAGLKNMVKYITESETFLQDLYNTDYLNRCRLVESLVSAANPVGADSSGKAEPRSLASKICKYLSQYLSLDNNDDYYFINDSFVRKTLPYYCAYYGVEVGDRKDYANKYENLYKILDDVRLKASRLHDNGQQLTRGKMDHIMWYCYKNSGNDDEFTRTRKEKKLKLEDVDKYLRAFVNLFGAIRCDEAYNLLLDKNPGYEPQLFTTHINKLATDGLRYYKIENNIVSLSSLSDEDISNLFELQEDSGFDGYELPSKIDKYSKTSYMTDVSTRLAKAIKQYSKCKDLDTDELSSGIKIALFNTFETDLSDYIANTLVGRFITEQNADKKIRDCKVRLPFLKGHMLG